MSCRGESKKCSLCITIEELTMKEIAIVLGIGESRVSQLHTQALPRLRARICELMQKSVPTCLSESSGDR